MSWVATAHVELVVNFQYFLVSRFYGCLSRLRCALRRSGHDWISEKGKVQSTHHSGVHQKLTEKDHVLAALRDVGFTNFLHQMTSVLRRSVPDAEHHCVETQMHG